MQVQQDCSCLPAKYSQESWRPRTSERDVFRDQLPEIIHTFRQSRVLRIASFGGTVANNAGLSAYASAEESNISGRGTVCGWRGSISSWVRFGSLASTLWPRGTTCRTPRHHVIVSLDATFMVPESYIVTVKLVTVKYHGKSRKRIAI
jgi:hypothetical protein